MMTRVMCLNPSSDFFKLYVYFSPECKVKTKNNQEENSNLCLWQQATRAHVPQNLRPQTGDCKDLK